MKYLLLFLVSYILTIILTPFIVLINIFRYGIVYLLQVAIGFDQAGGSVLFNEEDYTISSYCYLKCISESKLCWLMKIIDKTFGNGHCGHSYVKEKSKLLKEANDGLF